jgi:putative oxidoreductase
MTNVAAQSQMLLIGRSLVGVLFLVAGIRKLIAIAGTAAYFTKLGFPMPEVMTWLSVVIEIGGGLLLIAGWQTRRISWFLILYVAIAIAMAHRFWEFDAAQYGNQLNHFLKNLAVIGALLYIVVFGPGRYSVDERQGAGRPITA